MHLTGASTHGECSVRSAFCTGTCARPLKLVWEHSTLERFMVCEDCCVWMLRTRQWADHGAIAIEDADGFPLVPPAGHGPEHAASELVDDPVHTVLARVLVTLNRRAEWFEDSPVEGDPPILCSDPELVSLRDDLLDALELRPPKEPTCQTPSPNQSSIADTLSEH